MNRDYYTARTSGGNAHIVRSTSEILHAGGTVRALCEEKILGVDHFAFIGGMAIVGGLDGVCDECKNVYGWPGKRRPNAIHVTED